MSALISIVIPARNAASTLDACLSAASAQAAFEVIVVDDASDDDTSSIISRYPGIRHVRLSTHSGASRARNTGAQEARGDYIFFTDADCVMPKGTLTLAAEAISRHPDALIGGTYSPEPHDKTFWSRFQAAFINFSETKRTPPDYIATHAMLIKRSAFIQSGGFREDFMPILEDIEFSHRMRASGQSLIMAPEIEVSHIFNFTLFRSLRNAWRKTRYWARYSLSNRDIFKDSGTASFELKLTVTCWAIVMGCTGAYLATGIVDFLIDAGEFYLFCLLINIRFIRALYRAHGAFFTLQAMLYYTLLYPAPVAAGATSGIWAYITKGAAR